MNNIIAIDDPKTLVISKDNIVVIGQSWSNILHCIKHHLPDNLSPDNIISAPMLGARLKIESDIEVKIRLIARRMPERNYLINKENLYIYLNNKLVSIDEYKTLHTQILIDKEKETLLEKIEADIKYTKVYANVLSLMTKHNISIVRLGSHYDELVSLISLDIKDEKFITLALKKLKIYPIKPPKTAIAKKPKSTDEEDFESEQEESESEKYEDDLESESEEDESEYIKRK